LQEHGVRWTGLGRIRSNPDISLVRKGIQLVRENHMNGIAWFGRQGDWANHLMEEVISGVYNFVPHGAGLSVITLAWMKYVYRRHLPVFV
jgi:alcohol dehydrogenase YqhD (iron-dependent ADH family)